MNKRILLSLGMLAFAGAVVVGGTGAFFSDTETSVGNVFTAGSVTVGITGITHDYAGSDDTNAPVFTTDDGNGFSFALADLKPLDEGNIDYDLVNGANEAFICAMVTETGNHDNGRNDPELDAGDPDGGSGNGELGDFLNFNFNGNTGSLSSISGLWQTAGSGFDYCFGEFDVNGACVLGSGDDNLAQTDSLTADVEFYAVQTRNNEDFLCSSLNDDDDEVVDGGDQTPENGLGEYETMSATVVGGANNSYDVGETVAIADAYNGNDFTLTISEDEDGDRYVYTVNTPFAVDGTGTHSASLLFDTDNDGTADFQYEYLGGSSVQYKVNTGSGWTNAAVPGYYLGVLPDHANMKYTLTIPKSELDSTYGIASNVTQNNNVYTNAHLQMGIPVGDLFPGNDWTTSVNYLVVTQ